MLNRDLILEMASVETDECVLWPNGTDGSGYPKVFDGVRNTGGHRYIVEHITGDILTTEDDVMHSCDTPACVNPRHLSVGNAILNIRDCHAKGRAVNLKGSAHGRAKFDEAQVRSILELYGSHHWSVRQIADIIDAPYTRVWMVCKRRNWRHIQ